MRTHVVLAPGRERRVLGGHPWVFATEVSAVRDEACKPGDIVDVVTARGGFVGRGFINPASRILIRLLSRRQDEVIDESFYRRRIREAVTYRRALLGPGDVAQRGLRLVFAEADYLPAFIVDYFAGYLVFQALALGVDVAKDLLVRLVREEAVAAGFPVLGVYERDDAPVRGLEGLPLTAAPYWGEVPPRVIIHENGIRVIVDPVAGQKTGYFLDQRENRAAIVPYLTRSSGDGPARVLDCFSYTGAFSLAAAAAGAAAVLGVDASAEAIALARDNARLNGLDVSFLEANVFDFLRGAGSEGRTWDVIILDPPAFARNKAALPGARRGYKEINLRAMRLIAPGGYLMTSSCSGAVSEELFRDILASAAADTKRRVRVVEVRSQARDHPVLLAAPETRYLKFFVLRVE